jgi:hypothetical protein
MPPPIPHLNPISSSHILPSSYILSINPIDATSTHLALTHPSTHISLVDAQTLQLIDTFRDGHVADVTAVATGIESDGRGGFEGDTQALWSAGMDACVVRWDERSRSVGQKIRGG